MSVNNLVKRLQNEMRGDAGINGDAQRIEQMVWMFFLKVYDAQEEIWEYTKDKYKSIIPENMRWRNTPEPCTVNDTGKTIVEDESNGTGSGFSAI